MPEWIVKSNSQEDLISGNFAVVGRLYRCWECEFRYEGVYRGRRVMMCDYMDPEEEDMMSDDDFCSRGKNNAAGCSY